MRSPRRGAQLTSPLNTVPTQPPERCILRHVRAAVRDVWAFGDGWCLTTATPRRTQTASARAMNGCIAQTTCKPNRAGGLTSYPRSCSCRASRCWFATPKPVAAGGCLRAKQSCHPRGRFVAGTGSFPWSIQFRTVCWFSFKIEATSATVMKSSGGGLTRSHRRRLGPPRTPSRHRHAVALVRCWRGSCRQRCH